MGAPVFQAAVVAELFEQAGGLRQAQPLRLVRGAQVVRAGVGAQYAPVAHDARHRIVRRRVGLVLHALEQHIGDWRTTPVHRGGLALCLRAALPNTVGGLFGDHALAPLPSAPCVFQCCQPASAHSTGMPMANTAIERVSTGKPATIWNAIKPA